MSGALPTGAWYPRLGLPRRVLRERRPPVCLRRDLCIGALIAEGAVGQCFPQPRRTFGGGREACRALPLHERTASVINDIGPARDTRLSSSRCSDRGTVRGEIGDRIVCVCSFG
jgi:hypothetical protein